MTQLSGQLSCLQIFNVMASQDKLESARLKFRETSFWAATGTTIILIKNQGSDENDNVSVLTAATNVLYSYQDWMEMRVSVYLVLFN